MAQCNGHAITLPAWCPVKMLQCSLTEPIGTLGRGQTHGRNLVVGGWDRNRKRPRNLNRQAAAWSNAHKLVVRHKGAQYLRKLCPPVATGIATVLHILFSCQ